MKQHILFVLPLAIALCLSGCAGRPDLPTGPPTSATEDTPQAARWLTLGQSKKDHRNSIKITVVLWWRRGELNPRPKTLPQEPLRAQTVIYIPLP